MLRLHEIAFASGMAILASTAGALGQTAQGAQCTPPVSHASRYDNCRLVTLQKGMVCRCNVRSQAALQTSSRPASLRSAAVRAEARTVAPADRAEVVRRPDERALTVSELQQIYSGRTWVWSEGGGYFDPSGAFYAAVGNSPTSAFLARGRWTAGSQGELCFQALWNGQVGKNAEKTCFYHKVANGNILQKRGEDGEWYVFRNARARPKDEFRKIVLGNRISDKMSDIRSKYLYGIIM
ncbi:uncharacterized protein DUF995 [Microvirga subterranea]|uniref:Uncharacterized protein DUF995 n=1 Tax=Microvirga subterranea TaxID=186651 RepID=A0A370H4J9_9HYPH|nr:uncharacterized protein DUF995 [Microvirga subterranea]